MKKERINCTCATCNKPYSLSKTSLTMYNALVHNGKDIDAERLRSECSECRERRLKNERHPAE